MPNNFEIARAAFFKGESLENAQVTLLLTKYRAAEKGLKPVSHPSYTPVLRGIQDIVRRLEEIQQARRSPD